MSLFALVRRSMLLLAAVCLGAALTSCASTPRMPTAGEQEADKYLFDRGNDALVKKHWIDAREYFRKLVDTYPQSPYRQDAKLGMGDAYLGENRADSIVLASGEFREFLRFFPLNPRADYAQYRLALSLFKEMVGPERDQAPTREALTELDVFIRDYASSPFLPEVLTMRRQARDRLSDSETLVGIQYFRFRAYAGAVARFQGVLKDDPGYTRRDAVYYYLGESYYRSKRETEALPYFDKLVGEFQVSEYLERAKVRVTELKH